MSVLNDPRVYGPYANGSYVVDGPEPGVRWLVFELPDGRWRLSLPHDGRDDPPFGLFATAEAAIGRLINGG